MANPSGSVVDPGAGPNVAPTNKSNISFVDIFGDVARTEVGIDRSATTAQAIAIMTATAAISMAGINSAGITITLENTEGTPESGANESVSTKGIFTFRSPTSLLHADYEVPAPRSTIFQPDGITINRTNGLVTAYFTALTAAAEYTSGEPVIAVTDIRQGYRFQRRGTRPRVARYRE